MAAFTDRLPDVVRPAILPSDASAGPGRNRQAGPWR